MGNKLQFTIFICSWYTGFIDITYIFSLSIDIVFQLQTNYTIRGNYTGGDICGTCSSSGNDTARYVPAVATGSRVFRVVWGGLTPCFLFPIPTWECLYLRGDKDEARRSPCAETAACVSMISMMGSWRMSYEVRGCVHTIARGSRNQTSSFAEERAQGTGRWGFKSYMYTYRGKERERKNCIVQHAMIFFNPLDAWFLLFLIYRIE